MMNSISDIFDKLLAKRDLAPDEMTFAMTECIGGKLTPAQVGAFLCALRNKGETVDELTAAAQTMRKFAVRIDSGAASCVDTAGTGGDKSGTFNISTCAAFVASGAGVTVAKHGNRGVSSKCGSADVLAAAGFNLDVNPIVMEECIQSNGIGFLFAQKMHPAMKNVAPIRRELGFRTIFNMLGPLTNPAGATGQIVGVYSPLLTETFAEVLKRLGLKRALVVHGHDCLDEITCCAATRITELRNGVIKTSDFYPELVIGESYPPESIKGGTAEDNAKIMLDVLSGKERSAKRAVVLLNAAGAIVAGGLADSIADGVKMAEKSIDSGSAMRKFEILIEASKR